MKYYDEDTVYELMSAAEESATAYEFGVHKSVDIKDYPSIEIKEPHGRLIDADEFKASIHMNHLGKFATNRDVQVLYKLLNEAPTVLEASND